MIFPPRYVDPEKFKESMSLLYKAFDTETNQYVVIKVPKENVHSTWIDSRRLEMFQHEIELARTLEHPHILKAIDVDMARLPGRMVPFITFPFLEDGSLADFIDNFPPWEEWTLLQTVDVVMQAASALEYIHQQYIPVYGDPNDQIEKRPLVHRDVKLDNFLVQRVNRPDRIVHVYLSDFGIARTQRMTIDITNNPF
jgi:serine/threonine protein kinase